MNNVIALRVVQQINFWGMFASIAALFWLNQWYYYALTGLCVLLIAKGGSSIGQHRYFSHRSFQTTPLRDKILLWLATLSTTGTTLQYAAIHRYHHRHSDVPEDVHAPLDLGAWRCWFHWYRNRVSQMVGPAYIKDLLKRPDVMWHHKWYFALIAGYVLLLAAIDPWLILFCYTIPAGYAWFNGGVLSLPLHIKGQGYRNFDTPDNTNNSRLWNWLTLGEGLHNNHHHRPQEYNFAFTGRPGEWDMCAWVIDRLLRHDASPNSI